MKPLSFTFDTTLATLNGVAAKKAPTKLSNTQVSLYPSCFPVSQTPSTATAMLTVSFVYLKELSEEAGGTISKTDVPTIDALIVFIDWARIRTPTTPIMDPHT